MNKRLVKKNKISFKFNKNLWSNPKLFEKKEIIRKKFKTNNINTNKNLPVFKQRSITIYKRRKIPFQQFKNFYFNLKKKQIFALFERAKKRNKNIWKEFIISLESRLDTVLYRIKFGGTFTQIRQEIGHKYYFLNNKKVNLSQNLVKGDFISLNSSNCLSFKGNNNPIIDSKSLYLIKKNPVLKKSKEVVGKIKIPFNILKNHHIKGFSKFLYIQKQQKDSNLLSKTILILLINKLKNNSQLPINLHSGIEVNFNILSCLYINHTLNLLNKKQLQGYEKKMQPILEYMS